MRGDKARIVGNIPFPYVNLAARPVIDVTGRAFFIRVHTSPDAQSLKTIKPDNCRSVNRQIKSRLLFGVMLQRPPGWKSFDTINLWEPNRIQYLISEAKAVKYNQQSFFYKKLSRRISEGLVVAEDPRSTLTPRRRACYRVRFC